MSRISKSVVVFFVLGVLILPFLAFARTCEVTDIKKSGEPDIKLQVAIGEATCVSGISEYISTFYNFFVGAVATLAIFMIVIGGVKWLFARGNPGKIGAAKKTIESAVLGMLLVFVSVALLRIINPDLISLKLPKLKSIQQVLFYDTIKCNDPLLKGKEIKVGDQKFPGGEDNNLFECGDSYNIEGTQQVCAGTACVNEKGEKGTCTPLDCLYGAGVWGSISWEGNYYVDDMWLVAVCPDLSTKRIIHKKGDVNERSTVYIFPMNTSDLEGVLIPTTLQISKHCGGTADPRGYLLEVEVNDAKGGWTWDDPFLLDASCSRFVRKRDDPSKFAKNSDSIPSDTSLFSIDDLKARRECNIMIKRGVSELKPIVYQAGIERQMEEGHATEALKSLLGRISEKMPIVVTSISDSNIFTRACKPWLISPIQTYNNKTYCQHGPNSAHYGGTSIRPAPDNIKNFSCAADIKPVDEKSWVQLEQIVSSLPHRYVTCELDKPETVYNPSNGRVENTVFVGCDYVPTIQGNKITHIHVSVEGCEAN